VATDDILSREELATFCAPRVAARTEHFEPPRNVHCGATALDQDRADIRTTVQLAAVTSALENLLCAWNVGGNSRAASIVIRETNARDAKAAVTSPTKKFGRAGVIARCAGSVLEYPRRSHAGWGLTGIARSLRNCHASCVVVNCP
jgi:hypothetical protein